MKSLIIALVGFAVLTAGCVKGQQYRFVQQQPTCFGGPDPVPGKAGEKRPWPSIDCRHDLYSVSYIEFDGDGRFIDPLQVEKALKVIDHARTLGPNGKVIALVYVHGWKNNAAEAAPGGKAQDVERFRTALVDLGYRSTDTALRQGYETPVPIVGIYMGWRGKSLMGPGWFTFLSYWGRRNTANRVGGEQDFANALNRIIDRANDTATGSRVVLLGHSFGARVLEHGIEERSIPLYTAAGSGQVDPRVDLTLYVNSANDARLSLSRVLALRAQPVHVRHPDYDETGCKSPSKAGTPQCRDYPLLVAITSRGDLATKYLLPIANTLNLDPYKKGDPTPIVPPGDYVDKLPPPGIYQRSAAGHMKFMQSHVVREIACPTAPAPIRRPACSASDANCRFAFRTRGETSVCFQADQRVEVDATPATLPAPATKKMLRPFNQTAFWIMDVDTKVISDHGDIWNLSFVEMLGQLMAPRGFFEPDARRFQVHRAAAATAAQ